jgi:VanZ family protein
LRPAPPLSDQTTPGRRILTRILFWSAAAFAFVMAVIPRPPELPGHPSDKLQHIVAFLVLAILGEWAYPHIRKRYLLLGLAAFGAIIEVVQGLPFVGRDRDPLDWIADMGAAFTVFAIVALWTYWKEKQTGR